MTKNSLRRSFEVYLDMLDNCARERLYWLGLHILVIIPDICGALESNSGRASSTAYKDWCERYVIDPPYFLAEEWWEIRCKLLHQGRTVMENSRYNGYIFSAPDDKGNMAHLNVFGCDLNLDVSALIEWTKQGLNKWFMDIAGNKDPNKTKNVEKNLPFLIKITGGGRGLAPYIAGTKIPVLGSVR